MLDFNATGLQKYLNTLTLGVDVVNTPIVYVYLVYSLEYTQTLRISVSNNVMLVLKAVCLAVHQLHQRQPCTTEVQFYADVTRQVMSFVNLLDRTASLAIEPVKHCEMLKCSGIVVEELMDETLEIWNPKLTIFSEGVPVFNDYTEWLLISIDDEEED